MMKILFTFILAAFAAFMPLEYVAAQVLNNAQIVGKLSYVGGPPPVLTGCTALGTAPQTDLSGGCTTSATSGSIVFGTPRTIAPRCFVADSDATSATSMPVYAVTTTQITLTTVINAHKLFWHCDDVSGG